ncbi:acyl-CoA thioesterase [Pseudohongiella acticola]|jgi:acyl-CoA thioester hydrolase|uniref:acyl-CoA thioesterase n=1 Tax=Pseudohongiella acticola TaxID=1524254 RepID=UPI0030EC1D9B
MTLFKHRMTVRDYECDMQGVVNNAVYQNYLEHARHEFLKTRGLDFARLTADGIIVVVVRAEIDFLRSLRSGDAFDVSVAPVRESKIRLAFEQTIVHAETAEMMLRARVITTAVNERGRPYLPTALQVLLS